MVRPVGNPEFGTKYRFELKGDRPLSEEIKTKIDPELKLQLKATAAARNCSVPDLVREALRKYLSENSFDIT